MMEKKIRKYVIATLTNPTMYLQSLHFGKYAFLDIVGATKFMTKGMANNMISFYRHDLCDYETELVVLPVEITYELIKEK